METLDSVHRTIIIENIPNEATEDRLIDKLRQAGNVLKCRLIRDPDLLNNNNVAYCEYGQNAMALNALKILNGVEFMGQKLRVVLLVENPAMINSIKSLTETNKEQSSESGEAISQAVASLPPDQMYELMKQMKLCVQNNPNEARNMLLQNPQLAYALLQAQIVMKIVDPKVAIAMLNRSSDQIPQMTLESSLNKKSTEIQAHGRKISVYPNQESSQNSLGASSSFDGLSQATDPRIPTLSKIFVPYDPITFKPDVPQSNFQSVSVNNADFHRLKKGGAPDIVNSLGEGDERQKAALIIQVLKLTDQQIAMLPEDQRRSILVLKDQLRKP